MHYSTKSNQETGATVYSPSDGSELIPAEVKLDINGQNIYTIESASQVSGAYIGTDSIYLSK